MPNPAGPGTSLDHSGTLRQLKLLVLVLVLSNIGLGAFAYYLLRSTDANYSVWFGRSVVALNDLRAQTARLAEVRTMLGGQLIHATEAQRAAAVHRAELAVQADRQFRKRLLADPWPPATLDSRSTIAGAGDEVDDVCEQIVHLTSNGDTTAATALRQQRLGAAYDAYFEALASTAGGVEGASLKANDALTARTGNMSNVVLGLAGWPVFVLFALLVLTAVFVVVLMILFRGREMGDTP